MSYKLRFNKQALSEWDKLDNSIQKQFKKKLKERLHSPVVLASKVSGADNCFKIKLRSVSYRLVYHVQNDELVVLVLAIGKREKNAVYKVALKRV